MQEESDVDLDDSEVKEAMTKSDCCLYQKIYQRFTYYSPNIISKLYKVTLERSTQCVRKVEAYGLERLY